MGDPNGSPDARDAALRSALERVVLLECRAQESPGPSASSNALELARWRAEAQRAAARAASAEAQRDRLFARLIEAERTHAGLTGEPEGPDLAAFIAELRAELGRLEQARDVAEKQRAELLSQLRQREQADLTPRSPEEWAERLSAQGVLPDPGTPILGLERDLVAGSPAERALLKGILRDLSGDDAALREAAADRLAALPAMLAAPVFAAALSREADAAVLAKLVRGAGLTGVASMAPLVSGLRKHDDPRVRAAVLFAEVRLVRSPPAKTWLKDSDPRVRRRAALAAVLRAPGQADTVLQALGEDSDAGVRQAVAAGASALPVLPEALLLRMAQDPELRVRKAALRGLSAPAALAELPAAERRKALREILRGGPRADPSPPVEASAAPVQAQLDLDAAEAELRASLRGRTPEQLARVLGVDVETLNRALEADEHRFVQRGPRWFAR